MSWIDERRENDRESMREDRYAQQQRDLIVGKQVQLDKAFNGGYPVILVQLGRLYSRVKSVPNPEKPNGDETSWTVMTNRLSKIEDGEQPEQPTSNREVRS
jgi:hypothetical protein